MDTKLKNRIKYLRTRKIKPKLAELLYEFDQVNLDRFDESDLKKLIKCKTKIDYLILDSYEVFRLENSLTEVENELF